MNITDEAIRITHESIRAQVKLLASIAPLGRFGLRIARDRGVTVETFTEDDTIAIWTALELAEQDGRIRDVTETAKLVRAALRITKHWDDEDNRSFIAGDTWGPGSLGALFYRMAQLDAEDAIPRLAAELHALTAELSGLMHRQEAAA